MNDVAARASNGAITGSTLVARLMWMNETTSLLMARNGASLPGCALWRKPTVHGPPGRSPDANSGPGSSATGGSTRARSDTPGRDSIPFQVCWLGGSDQHRYL